MSQRIPVSAIYWEELYAEASRTTFGDNRNVNESQNPASSRTKTRIRIQNHPNASQNEDFEMKIYEDVGNSEELEEEVNEQRKSLKQQPPGKFSKYLLIKMQ